MRRSVVLGFRCAVWRTNVVQSVSSAQRAQRRRCKHSMRRVSPSSIMAAGNISPRSTDSQKQKRSWKERSRRRLERAEQLSQRLAE